MISGRTWAAEKSKPTFDVMEWVYWRRSRWLGKALRGDKGKFVLNAVHWGFQHRRTGDVFDGYPEAILTSFHTLVEHAHDPKFWSDYCDDLKPEKWIRHDEDACSVRCKPVPNLNLF